MRHCVFMLFVLLSLTARAAEPEPMDRLFSQYEHLTPEQLLDTATWFTNEREYDTALICYRLIIDTPETGDDPSLQEIKGNALNRSAVIHYYWMSDYVRGYQLLTEALQLLEAHPSERIESKVLTNIGNIYYRLDDYREAGHYYQRALAICPDSTDMILLLNNISSTKLDMGELDSASWYIEKALRMSGRDNRSEPFVVLNRRLYLLQTAGWIDLRRGLYDSAFRYFGTMLDEARGNRVVDYEAEGLSDLGEFYFATGRLDQAESHIAASNAIARESNNLGPILQKNHLLLSKIERARGRYREALEHFEMYSGLKDTLLKSDKLASSDQLRRIGEISNANRQIESMAVEQRIKERTIGYQKVILLIVIVVLGSVVAVLLFVFNQKRKLNRTYRTLVAKNLKIMELQEDSPRNPAKRSAYSDNDGELLDRILAIMEKTEVVCNPKFSINMLSSLVEANHTYVSQVINATMNKNFRSFLNEYRIREAQRLLSRSDAVKFTLESISLQLGYKSQNTFRAAFQEITGVTPGFYLKSIRETVKE